VGLDSTTGGGCGVVSGSCLPHATSVMATVSITAAEEMKLRLIYVFSSG
jgi:hypothetical protein